MTIADDRVLNDEGLTRGQAITFLVSRNFDKSKLRAMNDDSVLVYYDSVMRRERALRRDQEEREREKRALLRSLCVSP